MTPIRFALIGCGRIAKNHALPLQEIDGAKLAAACDIQPDRAQAFGQTYKVPVYTNYHDMLEKENVDVVSILTPSGMHPGHAIDIMNRYKKHVVIEKPMAMSLDDLPKMKAAADKNGVKIFPVYQNRYNKAVRKVRADLEAGKFGKQVLGTVRMRWCRPDSYYRRDPWRGTWAMDGGALTNQGIHDLDLLLHLMGDVESVYVRTATRLVAVEVEDTAVGVLTFKNGALGSIEITTAARPDDFEASISILGEKGTAILSGVACNTLSVYTLDPTAAEPCSEKIPDAYGFGHWDFFRDVLADLGGGTPHPISFSEGSRAIQFLNALYRSAEDGIVVRPADNLSSKKLGRTDLALSRLYETPALDAVNVEES
jgi:UDP-N-acetyl-2-amino-2-deoxyglucuronate dehydrogenase